MSILEAEAGRWLQVQGQPRLPSEHRHKVSKRECIEMDPIEVKPSLNSNQLHWAIRLLIEGTHTHGLESHFYFS